MSTQIDKCNHCGAWLGHGDPHRYDCATRPVPVTTGMSYDTACLTAPAKTKRRKSK